MIKTCKNLNLFALMLSEEELGQFDEVMELQLVGPVHDGFTKTVDVPGTTSDISGNIQQTSLK